ncbi:PREDICTED: syntenin-2-like, partial [Mesitornis unicolor]|uniref:syntenin-2-like n=1 Tax=Mesitornis unicolor TaxID=54374 RepID=UPI00052853E1
REIHLCKDERGKTGLQLKNVDQFQRTVTLHKDSSGHLGVVVKKGKIVSLAKDSSAARNGLLTHHCICEVNGQNVIGMKDKQLTEVLAGAGNVVTLTII